MLGVRQESTRHPVIAFIVIVGAALAVSVALEELAKSFRNKKAAAVSGRRK